MQQPLAHQSVCIAVWTVPVNIYSRLAYIVCTLSFKLVNS